MTKIPSVEAFWKMLESTQFVKTTNSITYKVEEHPPAIQDMEAIIIIHGEFDKHAIDNWLRQALKAQRDAGAREERERVVEKIQELNKYDYIPVQVKEENPSAWAMYTEGRDRIFTDLLSSLDKEIINIKE